MASRAQFRGRALLALVAVLVGGGALLALLGRGFPLPENDDLAPSRAAARPPRAKPAPDTVVVIGRCVDARTLSPIAWCTIRGFGRALEGPLQPYPAWRMEPARSDNDGRFRVKT